MIEYIQNNIIKNTMAKTVKPEFKKSFTLIGIQLNRGEILNTDDFQKSIHSEKAFLNVELGTPWSEEEADPIGDINRFHEQLKNERYR